MRQRLLGVLLAFQAISIETCCLKEWCQRLAGQQQQEEVDVTLLEVPVLGIQQFRQEELYVPEECKEWLYEKSLHHVAAKLVTGRIELPKLLKNTSMV